MKNEQTLKINNHELKLTNFNKVFWPKEKYTKGDVIAYYDKIAPFILPYLKDRPESLNRHPNGIAGKNFFQKDVDHIPPAWVKLFKDYAPSTKKYIHYLICQNKATLIYLINLGCIEINPWNSQINHPNKPDFMIIDLDPEGVSFDQVVEVAQEVHKVLEKIGARGYCKTSGATGLHIYVPLGAKYPFVQVRDLAHKIVMEVNKRIPKITSLERHPAKRRHKVYLDYLQNSIGQTLAAPYSLRPKPGATVSTPLEWQEVKKGLRPAQFTIKTIFKRLQTKKDLFKPVLGKGIDLKKALKQIEK